MKSFIVKCILAVCITSFCLFYLDLMYEQKSEDPIAELNQYNFIEPGIQIANTGSSHGMSDFEWDVLEDMGYQCFNFALTSQTLTYDHALLNMYQDDLAEGGILFIPLSYFSFNTETVNETEAQAMSIRYYRILSPEYNPDYSFFTDLVSVRLPILSAGEDMLKILEPPITFPSLSENRQNIVYAAEASHSRQDSNELSAVSQSGISAVLSETVSEASVSANAFQTSQGTSDVSDSQTSVSENSSGYMSALSSYDVEALKAEAAASYDEATIANFEYKGQQRFLRHFQGKEELIQQDKIQELQEMIDLCRSKNITPILITTPFMVYYNQYVSDEFMNAFYQTIEMVASEKQVSYYDYSHDERFAGKFEYFADADHLNEEGALYFTNLLTEEIPEFRDFLGK